MKSGVILLKLISSLTPSEKGYFKRQASLNRKDSKQLRLFDYLCQQNSYKSEDIEKKFENEDFVKNLRIINKALNEAILKSMRSYHSQKSASRILPELLLDIEFTFKKELYESCEELIDKGFDIATSRDLRKFAILFRHWKFRIRKRTLQDYEMNLEWLMREKQDYLKDIRQIENETHLFFWESKVLSLSKNLNNQDVTQQLDNALEEEDLLQFGGNDLSTLSRFRYYSVCGLYYYYARYDFEKAYEYYKKGLELLRSQKEVTVVIRENHVSALITLMSNATYTNKYDDFIAYRKELDTFPQRYSRLKRKSASKVKDFLVPIIDLMFHNHFGELEKAEVLYNDIKEKEEEYLRKHEYFSALKYYMLGYYQFLKGNYDDSFGELSNLFLAPGKETNDKIFYHSKVLTIILHWELDNLKYLPNLQRSFSRYLNKEKRKFDYEKCVIRCIKAKIKARSSSALRKEMQGILIDLEKNRKELIRELPYFDIYSWVKSKVEGKPMVEIMARKKNQPLGG